jgi:predicted Zn finger-like uncharacterized protein
MKVNCPECDAPVRVPSDHPAGKKVRCPDCDYAFRPAADDIAPARSRRSRDDDDRPRRSRGKTKSNTAALVAIPIVAFVLLAVGSAVAYFGFIKKKDDDPGLTANNPPANTGGPRVAPAGPTSGVPKAAPNAGGGSKVATSGKVGLNIGDTAPEIDGDDIDGKDFKLSDYRGKVVMLDFWGHW